MKSGVASTVLVWVFLFCGPVDAQDTTSGPPAPTQQAPPALPSFRTEVVVTAERGADERDRLPVATSVITRDQLDQRSATTLADAVQMLPGFQVLFTDASGLMPASVSRPAAAAGIRSGHPRGGRD